MRRLMTIIWLALVVSAGASLPAVADAGDRESNFRDWSNGPRYFYTEPAERPQRQRQARATYSDYYGDEDARPRRRSYDAGDRTFKRRHVTPRHATPRHIARAGKKTRRHHIARQPTKSHQRKVAVQRERPSQSSKLASAPSAPAPAWRKKSLSTDGPRGSGQLGVASYYWQPQRVASGGWFDPNAMTAAHKSLPFGTLVRVTHLGSGRSVEVKINDRGPFIAGRIIDLSKAAAGVIGMTGQGIARVAVEVLGR
jgi:rare lipoprotein A